MGPGEAATEKKKEGSKWGQKKFLLTGGKMDV